LKTRQGLRQLLYHCPTCNRRFKNQQERERHLLIHGPQPPFACLLCDHTATKMDALAAHVRKHLFLYVCSVCDKKLVSSQRLRGHLEESHSELDMEETFADCIKISYYLIPPEGGGGSKEVKDTEREMTFKESGTDRTKVEGEKCPNEVEEQLHEDGMQEQEEEQTKSEQVMEEEKGKEERLNIGGAQKHSQDKCDEAAAEERLHNPAPCVSAADTPAEKTHSSLSPGSVHTSSLGDRTQENTQADAGNTSVASNIASSLSSGISNVSDLTAEIHSPSDSLVENSQASPTEKESRAVCPICQRSYPQHRLKHHLKSSHPDKVPVGGKGLMVQRAEKCPYCDSYFLKNSSDFQQHIWAHQGRKFRCSECPFTSVFKPSLLRHMEQHAKFKVSGETEAQYAPVENEEHTTEAPLAVLDNNDHVQQIAELSSETHNAVASMVAVAPGTVTVLQQLRSQEKGYPSFQLVLLVAAQQLQGGTLLFRCAEEQRKWEKVASCLNAGLIEPADLLNWIDHRELWRGGLVIREKKVSVGIFQSSLSDNNSQVGALFSLSCIITPIAQPPPSQLSSQRWKECLSRTPKSFLGMTLLNQSNYAVTHSAFCYLKSLSLFKRQSEEVSASCSVPVSDLKAILNRAREQYLKMFDSTLQTAAKYLTNEQPAERTGLRWACDHSSCLSAVLNARPI
ncbi:hypothetical protein GOODEAATRI_003462, partial [Goodea atripinnis]